MALGKPNRVGGKAYSIRLKTKGPNNTFLTPPQWEVQAKNDKGEYETLSDEKIKELFGVEAPLYDVSGDLVSIDTREGSYEGDPIYNVSLGLRDADKNEIYFTGFTVGSSLGRKLANSVLNLKAFDNVQVGLYAQTNKETKKSYGAAALRQGNETATVKGKFDFKTNENLQPREFEGKGGKMEKDWSKPDAFLFAELKEFAKLVEEANKNRPKPAPKAVEPTQEEPVGEQADAEGEPPF